MQNLFAAIGIVQKTDEGLVVALVLKRPLFVIDGKERGVPLVTPPVLFVWVEGPEQAYIESMERLGLASALVFDFGEDAFRVAAGLAQWAEDERITLSDRSKPRQPTVEVPF